MPIHPLPVLSEEAEQRAIDALTPPKTVVVRYGYMKQIGEFPYEGDQVIGCGTKLVVRSPRGVEIGEMLTTTCPNSGCGSSISREQMLQYIENSGGKQYPFSTQGKVLRLATVEDMNDQSRLDACKPQYVKAAKAQIKELDLPMKLIDVEPLLSKDKIVFYFTAENRVDFRELVKRLAKEMYVRVEMRQVGARDEARLIADYEKCGQHCCCKQFLKVLKPVSMRSAKIQKATLDPTKISGRCGRLMCCLRYEDKTYDDLRKNLPRRKSRVITEDGPGVVISTQILTQLALIELDSGQRAAYPVEHLEPDDGTRPAPQVVRDDRNDDDEQRSDRGPRRPKPGRPLRDDEVESREGERADSADASTESNDEARNEGESDAPKKRKRRRRRRGRRRGGGDDGSPS